ncbi:prolyl oligopeptidase family serine peptidase [Synechococcus sp. PCC 6312]|uniref:S9 family peptidase n=1 Tax=Synechococcus sp. (strain ATCC 27167 / PCC 6312) TaxID=195253 RepID=UPI00029F1601|nr:prolyl oligopeptidase family serine peptidase [Synechococcus sp. PCC 6312]AFY59480.1 dipeptidyl aminopeptidase/acylaminoacyl peptidase [Synechococcus sp. PCC 6312]
MPTIASYGAWESPITTDFLVADSVGLGSIALDGAQIYWLESRPQEKGRTVLVQQTRGDHAQDLTPAPWNVRSRVHEYGGGAYGVDQGEIYFINNADQQVYYLSKNSREPQALTNCPPCRYANGIWDRTRHRLIFVQEDHQSSTVSNTLVTIPLPGSKSYPEAPEILVEGADFYSSPTLSPDGQWLAWLSWNHPQMPWDGCELWVAPVLTTGKLGDGRKIAGSQTESVGQPRWLDNQTLIFMSDRSGWGNPYQWQTDQPQHVLPLLPQALELEFGTPHWVFGQSTYAIADQARLICTVGHQGIEQLGILDLAHQTWEIMDLPFTDFHSIQANADRAYFVASSPTNPSAIIELDLRSITSESTSYKILKTSTHLPIDPDYLAVPQALCFPTTADTVAYGFYYPPTNPNFVAPASEKPPLLVKCHGGPTAATSTGFNLGIQFWTSRGFACLDVNYRGSTGYGRDYQDALQGHWGVYDVADCIAGAEYLVEKGRADPQKLAMRGSSAGGYTTLAALTFSQTFQAGASYYGVSDLEALAQDTHKFEARYFDGLVAPYPTGQQVYYQRSPIHFVEQLAASVIFFQGLEDKVVPPNQAEMMVNALIAKGIPVAYLTFPAEAHGFRQASTIQQTLAAELYFYGQIFGFTPAGEIPSIPIQGV